MSIQAMVCKMPTDKPKKPVVGRPKGSGKGRIKTAFAVKCTPEYKAWMADFAATAKAEMADLFREAMRRYAEECKFRQPTLK